MLKPNKDNLLPVVVFFKAIDVLNEPRLAIVKRNRNYEALLDEETQKVWIKSLYKWIPVKHCSFLDFSFNEKLVVLNSVYNTPLQPFDIVNSVTRMMYDENVHVAKVKIPDHDEVYDVIVEFNLRPLKLME